MIIKNKSITAILPMRKGSVRVKNKNIRELNGKPLYEFIIQKLLNSKYINKICIDTDIEEIFQKYSSNTKKFILLKREKKLRGNCNINHVINKILEKITGKFFIQVHATNPFLSTKTIDKNIYKFLNQNIYDSFFSVSEFQKRLWNNKTLPINHNYLDEPTTQNLEKIYEENSCLYLFSRNSFLNNANRIGNKPKMVIIPKNESYDIDDEYDFIFASNFFKTK